MVQGIPVYQLQAQFCTLAMPAPNLAMVLPREHAEPTDSTQMDLSDVETFLPAEPDFLP